MAMKLDHDDLNRLIEKISTSDIQEFSLEGEDFKLEIKRNLFDQNQVVNNLVSNTSSDRQTIDNEKTFNNISSIKIVNMKINQGHARCIATGLKYIYEKEEFDYVIPMDGDGEDRPEEIKELIE